MHYQSFFVEILAGLWSVLSKIQFAINIIFNKWDIMFSDKLHKFFLILIRHTTSKRIAKIGNKHAGFYCMLLDHLPQVFNIRTHDCIGANLNNL